MPLSVRVSLRLSRSEIFTIFFLGVHSLIAFVVHQIKGLTLILKACFEHKACPYSQQVFLFLLVEYSHQFLAHRHPLFDLSLSGFDSNLLMAS